MLPPRGLVLICHRCLGERDVYEGQPPRREPCPVCAHRGTVEAPVGEGLAPYLCSAATATDLVGLLAAVEMGADTAAGLAWANRAQAEDDVRREMFREEANLHTVAAAIYAALRVALRKIARDKGRAAGTLPAKVPGLFRVPHKGG